MPVMPDTRIALSGLSSGDNGPSAPSPLQTLGSMMQIKESQMQYEGRRLENEKRRRDLEDDDEVSKALMSHDRPEDAIQTLWKTGKSDAASKLTKDVMGARTAQWQEQDNKLKLTGNRLEHSAQILNGVDGDAAYQTVRPQLLKILEPEYGPQINDVLPTQYDPAKIKQLVNAGTGRAQQIQMSRDLIDNHIKLYGAGAESAMELAKYMPELKGPDGQLNPNVAKWSKAATEAQDGQRELLNRTLLTATSKEQYDGFLKTAYDNGMPKVVLDDTPPWIDDPKERHARLTMAGLSLKERAAAEAANRRSTDTEDRINDARDRAAAAERARDAAETRRGTLTPPQRHNEEDSNQKEVADTEKWVKEQWPDVAPTGKDKAGKTVRQGFGYDKLAKAREDAPDSTLAGVANEYVQRRVAAENKNRTRLQNLPPIDVAAKTAVANKDRASYDKLDKVYSGVTNGVGSLSEIVPWPSTDAEAKKKQAVIDIQTKLKDPTLTPAQKQALITQRNQLLSAR